MHVHVHYKGKSPTDSSTVCFQVRILKVRVLYEAAPFEIIITDNAKKQNALDLYVN